MEGVLQPQRAVRAAVRAVRAAPPPQLSALQQR